MSDICSDDHLVQLDSLPDDIDTVILAGTDTHGIMRGKRVPRHQLQRLLANGMPMCDVFWVMHIDESDLVARPANHAGYFPTEKNGYPDILARPDVRPVVPIELKAQVLAERPAHDMDTANAAA